MSIDAAWTVAGKHVQRGPSPPGLNRSRTGTDGRAADRGSPSAFERSRFKDRLTLCLTPHPLRLEMNTAPGDQPPSTYAWLRLASRGEPRMKVEELLKPFPIKEFHPFPRAMLGPGAFEMVGPEAIKLGFQRPLVMTS